MWHCRSRYRDGQNYTHELSGCHLQSSYGKKNPATAYRKEDSKKNQATGQQHIEKRVQLKTKITVIHRQFMPLFTIDTHACIWRHINWC